MPETGLDSWMLAGSKQWCKKRLTTTICWFLPLGFGLHSGLAKCIQTDSFSLQENKSLKPYRGMFNVQLVYPVFFYTPLYICPTSSLNREVGL